MNRVQCYRCGLFYDRALPCCPSHILGCGAPQRFVAELKLIAELEADMRDVLGRLMHLANSAWKNGAKNLARAAGAEAHDARRSLAKYTAFREALRRQGEQEEAAA